MIIGTIASGVGVATTFNLTYLPQTLAAINSGFLQSLKVEVLGVGVILDLNAANLKAFSNLGLLGVVTNGWAISLSDGLLTNKNVTITAVNGVAAAYTLYGYSQNRGSMYLRTVQAVAQANTGIDINNFLAAMFPEAASTDEFNVTFADGTVQKFTVPELPFLLTQTSGANLNTVSDQVIDNRFQTISNINYLPVAQRTIAYSTLIRA